MTLEEQLIVSLYTGVTMCDYKLIEKRAKELLKNEECGTNLHDYRVRDRLSEIVKRDFLKLCEPKHDEQKKNGAAPKKKKTSHTKHDKSSPSATLVDGKSKKVLFKGTHEEVYANLKARKDRNTRPYEIHVLLGNHVMIEKDFSFYDDKHTAVPSQFHCHARKGRKDAFARRHTRD